MKKKTTIVLYGPDTETILIIALLGPGANILYSDNEDKILEICGNSKIAISPEFHGKRHHLKASLRKKRMNNQIVGVGDWILSPSKEKVRNLKEALLSS